MNEKRGGIKTTILLFSLLVIISVFLLGFVFSIFVNNKAEIDNELTSLNECSDINYEILNQNYDDNNLTLIVRNHPNSLDIEKICVISDGELYEYDRLVGSNEITRVNIGSIPINGDYEIYVNDCKDAKKSINI